MSFELFKNRIKEFYQEVQELSAKHDVYLPDDLIGKGRLFNHTRTELGKKLYLLTRQFLKTFSEVLTAEEKGAVFEEYVIAWKKGNCELDINRTKYALEYKESRFRKYNDPYPPRVPMTAGFNLSGASLKGKYSMIFVDVNLNQANFSDFYAPYAHFENCLMNRIQVTRKTDLNHAVFEKCKLNSNDWNVLELCSTRFKCCSIIDTKLSKNASIEKCITQLPASYPHFLRHLKVPQKKLTAATVAHALWLSDKNTAATKASKLQFTLWAKEKSLSFTIQDVEQSMSKFVFK